MKKTFSGVNIQYPISRDILDGSKTIETRTYPLPQKYIGQPLALIETPGSKGKFKARIVGIVEFGESFQYENAEAFYADVARTKVDRDSLWAWKDEKPKWGWPVKVIKLFDTPIIPNKRPGIVFATGLELDVSL
jgi:hypothetical protein